MKLSGPAAHLAEAASRALGTGGGVAFGLTLRFVEAVLLPRAVGEVLFGVQPTEHKKSRLERRLEDGRTSHPWCSFVRGWDETDGLAALLYARGLGGVNARLSLLARVDLPLGPIIFSLT
jgi:hypothetical protein